MNFCIRTLLLISLFSCFCKLNAIGITSPLEVSDCASASKADREEDPSVPKTDWEGVTVTENPWVSNASRPYEITMGMEGRHIALWASHGRFYDQARGRWRWQRPPLYTTCEDLFTQTIVVPYLMPMLERAGAVVFTPRERDWQANEVIVDNDQLQLISYQEHNKSERWEQAPAKGFAFHEGRYYDGENPFEAGTARMVRVTKNKNKQSYAIYQPKIPEAGRYAVYVSYQTVDKSVDDARYTVVHQGQRTDFVINQRMGGSTWVYLGTFDFDAGCNRFNCVEVSNLSGSSSGVVTTDAVRFGGGMGNIARFGTTSGLPRCLEGARYYAQWAGMPYRVYASKEGTNDYAEDINVRSMMVNELCGGSPYAPDSAGRRVPIELSLAVHSDAGYNKPDGEGIFGTLTICTTHRGDSTLGSGRSREMSKELACELLDNTVTDLQHRFGSWNIREVYDRNYSETRVPVVPSAIIETLSHQNFEDMRHGLDPNFRFTMARSIYKTLLRYTAKKHHTDYVVAPLTPQNFRIEFTEKKGEVRISWSPTDDPQEPTARPTDYVLYIAEGDGGFDNGMLIHGTAITTQLKKDALVHFRVTAVNKGGESFPTQVLSACYRSVKSPRVMIVDAFHRLSSPALTLNGFDLDIDPGVNFGRSCGTLGHQRVFNRSRIGIEDSTGLGYTANDMEGRFIAGNDFCYVRTHSKAVYEAGQYNIVSCSSEAVDKLQLYQYDAVDVACGLEYDDLHSLVAYKSFPSKMRQSIGQYLAQGGRLLVSGAYLGTDARNDEEQRFLRQMLKCQLYGTYRSQSETISGLGTTFDFYHTLNEHHYAATSCDVLIPAEQQAFPAMAYADQQSAAVAYKGRDYRTFVMGFPFECIKNEAKRSSLMRGVLAFLLK